jgi:tetratricopeptide (TPR) repeat protein
VAEQKKDLLLLGTAHYGEAELYFVQDPGKAEAVWCRLKEKEQTHMDARLGITLQLALTQTRLLNAPTHYTVSECLDELKELGDRSLELGLVGPLPKVNLLNGFAYYKLGKFERANEEFLASYVKAEQTGYGVFLWFAQNNIALMHQCLGDSGSDRHILSAYGTALDKAEHQGFLRHLQVPTPLFFQSALVDNALRYYDRMGLLQPRYALEERLVRNGCSLEDLPRQGLTHQRFETPFGAMMLFV